MRSVKLGFWRWTDRGTTSLAWDVNAERWRPEQDCEDEKGIFFREWVSLDALLTFLWQHPCDDFDNLHYIIEEDVADGTK
jgi:hypothetical protein